MKCLYLIFGFAIGATFAQFPAPPLGGWGGSGLNRPSSYPKQPSPPSRPSPFSALTSVLPGGGSSSSLNGPQSYDDPIPQIAHDSSYDTQALPAKLPILAPNGVVEIYNRVVDDLIKRLETDFAKKKIDPMNVIIRSTPAGPVRVPGYLQRRPFRRPGAALYRNANVPLPAMPMNGPPKKKKMGRSADVDAAESTAAADATSVVNESRFPDGRPSISGQIATDEKTSFRGVGKVSKGPLSNEDLVQETTPAPESVEVAPKQNSTEQEGGEQDQQDPSSEEGFLIRARSDEYFPEEEAEEEEGRKSSAVNTGNSALKKKTKKDDTVEDDDEEEKTEGKTNVDSLIQRYQSKNTNKSKNTKYTGTTTGTKAKTEKVEKVKNKEKSSESAGDDDEDDVEQRDDPDMDNVSYNIDAEPGTGGGGRPQGGYYPPGGPPAIPAKPNAVMTGLSKMRRSSDVAVTVDARSAMITARLLVGPINVFVNESQEPKERGIKATIPELEAEMILMERHGVVFLQRFTLDRAYGQDIEISIPKSKGSESKKRKGSTKGASRPGPPGSGPQGFDPNAPVHPAAQDRFQTKMAAHISMEVVKLLRSGNLRVNLMRTAQGSMSKLKLPIQKPKTKKSKKEKKEEREREREATSEKASSSKD